MCNKDQFIIDQTEGWIPTEDVEEMTRTIRDMLINFSNFYIGQKKKVRTENDRDMRAHQVVHDKIEEIFQINLSSLEIANFSISLEDPQVRKIIVGLHNYEIFRKKYKGKKGKSARSPNDRYFIKKDLADLAAKKFKRGSTEMAINREFEKTTDGEAFAFALNNDTYVSIINKYQPNPTDFPVNESVAPVHHKGPADMLRFKALLAPLVPEQPTPPGFITEQHFGNANSNLLPVPGFSMPVLTPFTPVQEQTIAATRELQSIDSFVAHLFNQNQDEEQNQIDPFDWTEGF